VLDFLKERLRNTTVVESVDNGTFLKQMVQKMQLPEPKSLRFAAQRLKSLLYTLEVVDVDSYEPISVIVEFCHLIAAYTQGFKIIIEPFDERLPNVPDPLLNLACLDASLAIKSIFEHFQSVVITSGTLSPIDLYPKLLNFVPITKTFEMSLSRECICPMIVTRGSDQMPLNARFQNRSLPPPAPFSALLQAPFLVISILPHVIAHSPLRFVVSRKIDRNSEFAMCVFGAFFRFFSCVCVIAGATGASSSTTAG
jgi:DNA excision repair protein ERCC-2